MEVSNNPSTLDIINESQEEMKARHAEAIKKYLSYILNIRVTSRVTGHLVYHCKELYNLSLFMFERNEVEQIVENTINENLSNDSAEYKQELKTFIVDELYHDTIFYYNEEGIQHSRQLVELLLKDKMDAQCMENEWYRMLEYIITIEYKKVDNGYRSATTMLTADAICKHLEQNPTIVKRHGIELLEHLENVKDSTGDNEYVCKPILTINKIASSIQASV